MTGQTLKDAREELGLTRAQLALVLGVSHVTVYRWEEEPCQVNPLQNRLLAMVVGLSVHDDSARYGRALRAAVKRDPIYGLHTLLCMAFGEWAGEARKGTK
jgi:DNA-binding XRE family transcriptional regulator